MQIRTEYADGGERIIRLVVSGLVVTLRGEDAVEMLDLHDQEMALRDQIGTNPVDTPDGVKGEGGMIAALLYGRIRPERNHHGRYG